MVGRVRLQALLQHTARGSSEGQGEDEQKGRSGPEEVGLFSGTECHTQVFLLWCPLSPGTTGKTLGQEGETHAAGLNSHSERVSQTVSLGL